MAWFYPFTPTQAAWTLLLFSTGAALFATGARLSYANIGPQRERALARDEFVRQYLRKKFGEDR